MSLYDDVLNCPDTHCCKKALDKLCKEKIVEGMEKAAEIADSLLVRDEPDWAVSRIGIMHKQIESFRKDSEVSKEIAYRYADLIMQVGNKIRGESRHETARRYIQQAEISSGPSSDSNDKQANHKQR